MKVIKSVIAVLAVCALIVGIYGCKKQETPAEKAAREFDQAVDKAEQKVNTAIDKAGQKIKDTGQKMKDAVQDAKK